jgi:hypothetical protein
MGRYNETISSRKAIGFECRPFPTFHFPLCFTFSLLNKGAIKNYFIIFVGINK